MNYIVLDLEATCSNDNDWKGPNEIIEIGAIKYNKDLEIIDEFQSFIRPIINPILTPFCKDLTKIKQEYVDKADTFNEVLPLFQDFIGNNYTLCSWGFYDRSQFEKDCNLHKLDTNWLKPHISLKHQYQDIKNIGKCGLSKALHLEGLKFIGTPHRGIDDAKNIGKIFEINFKSWKFI